jgi:hypothetical protein
MGGCSNIPREYLNRKNVAPADTATGSHEGETCEVANQNWIGDGWCDFNNGNYNTIECAYDGGDCCQGSCEANAATNLYQCGVAGFYCLEPQQPSLQPTGAQPTRPQWGSTKSPTLNPTVIKYSTSPTTTSYPSATPLSTAFPTTSDFPTAPNTVGNTSRYPSVQSSTNPTSLNPVPSPTTNPTTNPVPYETSNPSPNPTLEPSLHEPSVVTNNPLVQPETMAPTSTDSRKYWHTKSYIIWILNTTLQSENSGYFSKTMFLGAQNASETIESTMLHLLQQTYQISYVPSVALAAVDPVDQDSYIAAINQHSLRETVWNITLTITINATEEHVENDTRAVYAAMDESLQTGTLQRQLRAESRMHPVSTPLYYSVVCETLNLDACRKQIDSSNPSQSPSISSFDGASMMQCDKNSMAWDSLYNVPDKFPWVAILLLSLLVGWIVVWILSDICIASNVGNTSDQSSLPHREQVAWTISVYVYVACAVISLILSSYFAMVVGQFFYYQEVGHGTVPTFSCIIYAFLQKPTNDRYYWPTMVTTLLRSAAYPIFLALCKYTVK